MQSTCQLRSRSSWRTGLPCRSRATCRETIVESRGARRIIARVSNAQVICASRFAATSAPVKRRGILPRITDITRVIRYSDSGIIASVRPCITWQDKSRAKIGRAFAGRVLRGAGKAGIATTDKQKHSEESDSFHGDHAPNRLVNGSPVFYMVCT